MFFTDFPEETLPPTKRVKDSCDGISSIEDAKVSKIFGDHESKLNEVGEKTSITPLSSSSSSLVGDEKNVQDSFFEAAQVLEDSDPKVGKIAKMVSWTENPDPVIIPK